MATAYLRSLPDDRLILERGRPPESQAEGHLAAAGHAPYFFKAIPVNTAERETLMTVRGIGPALAEAIIADRKLFGPFRNIEDLTRISGVGEKRAASLAPFLTCDEIP